MKDRRDRTKAIEYELTNVQNDSINRKKKFYFATDANEIKIRISRQQGCDLVKVSKE